MYDVCMHCIHSYVIRGAVKECALKLQTAHEMLGNEQVVKLQQIVAVLKGYYKNDAGIFKK